MGLGNQGHFAGPTGGDGKPLVGGLTAVAQRPIGTVEIGRMKTFVGTSPNALKTQIWTALIAMLILKYLQLKATFPWSISNLVALLRMNLFIYRDLWRWLNEPYGVPPLDPTCEQLRLALG